MGIAMRVLKNITDGVYDKLTKEGYFYNPVEREVIIKENILINFFLL
jgi:hypothetical protein